ncbi:MAG: conjugal transfer protein TraX [Lachnospiraceae bacterium]|nr:conjugal transfer protein TraX [Lachnospiraceae bacterium]
MNETNETLVDATPVAVSPEESKGGLPGSTLKIIAIITMFIDHTGAVILERYLSRIDMTRALNPESVDFDYLRLSLLDGLMRAVGRIAFPIFIFLLVQGFTYTHSRTKYVLRLALFCLIAEIPFNMAFRGKVFTTDYQSVFLTITIGFLFLWFAEDIALKNNVKAWLGIPSMILSSAALGLWVTKKVANTGLVRGTTYVIGTTVVFALIISLAQMIYGSKHTFETMYKVSFSLVGMAAAMWLADFLKTDYAGLGVLAIATCYAFRENKMRSMIMTIVALTTFNLFEVFAFLGLPFVAFYNGKRGLKLKYIFYIFYPVHLLILHLISWLAGFFAYPTPFVF